MQRLALSIDEAAASAGLGLTRLRQEIREGRLRARRVGGRVLITNDDLVAWLASLPPHCGAAVAEQPPETAG
jgi:excisionase family DNA binding protein